MIKYCAKCGKMITDEWIVEKKTGALIRNVVCGRGSDVFCRSCACSCFFIDGKMYKPEECVPTGKGVKHV